MKNNTNKHEPFRGIHKIRKGWETMHAPTYEELIVQYVRVAWQRDALLAALEDDKREALKKGPADERVLRILGQELFDDGFKLTGNIDVSVRNDLIVRRIRELRENCDDYRSPRRSRNA